MKYNNSQIKETCAIAWESNFGIRPKNKDIKIIDKKEDRTYILFSVGYHLYEFHSYIFHDNSLCAISANFPDLNGSFFHIISAKRDSISPNLKSFIQHLHYHIFYDL